MLLMFSSFRMLNYTKMIKMLIMQENYIFLTITGTRYNDQHRKMKPGWQ